MNLINLKPMLFDIETSALSDAELDKVKPPFQAPANYKDAAKIAANIAEQEAEWKARAALSPITGRVLAFGYESFDFDIIADDDEKTLLEQVWMMFNNNLSASIKVVGFNIFGFDLPFLIKRSWSLGVTVPRIVGGWSGRYWNWNEDIIDLRLVWQMGDRQAHGSLDDISKFFGASGKMGSGKDFAALWQTDREKAVTYLKTDLALSKLLYERMFGN